MMNRKLKLTAIGIGIFFGLIIVLIISALFLLETDMVQRFAQKKIQQVLPGKILWKHICFSWFRGSVEISNVDIKTPADESVISVDKVYARVSMSNLLKGKIRGHRLILEHPKVNLGADEHGKLKLVSAFVRPTQHKEEKKEKEVKHDVILPDISVEEIEITKGNVFFDTHDQRLKAEVDDVRIVGGGKLAEQSGNIKLTIGKGSFDSSFLKARLNSFQAAGNLKNGHIEPLDINIGIEADYTDHLAAKNIILNAHVQDRLITLEPLMLKTDAGDLNIRGLLDFQHAFPETFFSLHPDIEKLAYALTLNGKDLSLGHWFGNHATGNVNALLCLNGKGISPKDIAANADLEMFSGGLNAGAVSIPALKIKIQAGMEDHGIKLAFLDAEAGELKLHADGQYRLSSEEIRAAVSLNASDLEQSLAPLGIKGVKGKVEAKSDISGLIRKPVFDLNLKGNNLQFQDIVIGDADIAAAMDTAGNLKVSRLAIGNQSSEINGSGEIHLFDANLSSDFSLALNRIELRNFIHKDILKGMIDAKLDIKGSLKRPDMKISVNAEGLESAGIRIGNLNVSATSDQSGMVSISQLNLENKGSEIKGQGQIQVLKDAKMLHWADMPVNVSLDLRKIESKNFVSKEFFQGAVDGSITASGSLKMPDIALLLHGRDIGVDSVRLGNINADLNFSKGEVRVNEIKIHHRSSEAQISGTAQIMEKDKLKVLKSPSYDLSISGGVMLEDIVKKFKGQASLNAHLKGTIEHPTGNIRLIGEDIDVGVQKFSRINLKSELLDDKLEIRYLNIAVVPEERIEGKGWVSLQKTYNITLVSEGISILNINKLNSLTNVEGKVALELSGAGDFDNPRMSGNIALKDLRVKGNPMDNITLDIDLRDHIAKASGKLGFDLNARYNLKNSDFSTAVIFDNTDLTPYFAIAGQNDLNGMMSGKIEAHGNAQNIGSIQAHTDISRLVMSFKDREIVQAVDFTASFKNKEIVIPPAKLHVMKTGDVAVSGRAVIDGPASFDIDLQHIGFEIPETSQSFHDLNGRIHITPDLIRFENITAGLDSGRLELGGQISLSQFQPVSADMTFSTDALPIKAPNMLDMLLNAKFHLTGTPEKSSLQGETIIVEGRYYRNVNLNVLNMLQGVKEKKREIAEIRQNRPQFNQPFLKNLNLDIAIKRKNPFMVENNLAKLEIHPDLRIHGTLNAPLVSGRAEIPSGTITYQKRNFELKRGYIDFINPYKIEPSLDIEGTAEIRKWTVYLKVSGTPDNLNFNLSSTPAEEHGDILSLLLIGKTPRELIEKEGGNSQAPGQILAQMIAETFGDDLKKATGLDIFQVDFDDQDAKKGKNGSNGVKVTVGKELSRRMVVKYAVESKEGETIQKAIAEYKFLENIIMSAFQNTKGGFGGELQFRLEFR
jgi:autotransporter translocation and assembly factor TamB